MTCSASYWPELPQLLGLVGRLFMMGFMKLIPQDGGIVLEKKTLASLQPILSRLQSLKKTQIRNKDRKYGCLIFAHCCTLSI